MRAAAPPGRGPLGSTGLVVSRIGFGGYRVDDGTPEHREALRAALDSGCNLIDTSTNYTDGGSERLIGEVLGELAGRDRAAREAVVVVSKIGYVQGRNLELAEEREREGRPFPEMVRYADGCWHCIHPEFVRDQLARSRERLGVERLDICLLHNPEYFLADAGKRHGHDLEKSRDTFYGRLREAFACLEERAAAGEIGWYGVSSNTAIAPPEDPQATSITRMIAAAEAAGGPGHHFRVLQIPMNLFEAGGALVRNTGPGSRQTPLEAAAAAGLGVLINRPLNAFAGARLMRLAAVEPPPQRDRIEDLAARLRSLEKEYHERVAPGVQPADAAAAAHPLFALIEQVIELASGLDDPIHWQQIQGQYVVPRVNHVVASMARGLDPGLRQRWGVWWDAYFPTLQGLFYEVGRRAAAGSRARAEEIVARIDPALPADKRREPLSRKALWVLASTPGVSCVLVGMRRLAYVADAMGILSWPPLPDPLEVYQRLPATRR